MVRMDVSTTSTSAPVAQFGQSSLLSEPPFIPQERESGFDVHWEVEARAGIEPACKDLQSSA